ncbi:MAG: GGDEF domain-containing protein [Acidimicrobiales bacterium]|jgi:diguanylate cyclase (GGDEF)-like protein|nr:GGDEF domain-containing protein [Acidimicrobiales bacterium]
MPDTVPSADPTGHPSRAGHLLAVLQQFPPGPTTVGCLAVVAGIGLLDWVAGHGFASSVLYVIPVGVAAWVAGQRAGQLLAVVSALVGFAASLFETDRLSAAMLTFNAVSRGGLYLLVAWLVSGQRELVERTHELAARDPLTGLLNRRALAERAAPVLAQARRERLPVTVAYADVDQLKLTNDQGGHGAGDQLLSAFAHLLRHELRASDLAARIGGDEFALVLVDADEDGTADLLGRLHRGQDESDPPLSVSWGAVVVPDGAVDLERALDAADALMYEAKQRRDGPRIELSPGAPGGTPRSGPR